MDGAAPCETISKRQTPVALLSYQGRCRQVRSGLQGGAFRAWQDYRHQPRPRMDRILEKPAWQSGSLPEVVRHWHRTGETIDSRFAEQAVEEFLHSTNHSRRTDSDTAQRLHKFAEHFHGRKLHELSTADVDDFLKTISAGHNRSSTFKKLSVFFKAALQRRWITVNPMALLAKPQIPKSKREIYAASDLHKMLWEAEKHYPELVPYLTLMAYGFLRSSELVPRYSGDAVLQWNDIEFGDGFMGGKAEIHVRAEVAKVTRRANDERWVPLSDTALDWLRSCRKSSGPCVTLNHEALGKKFRQMIAAAGVLQVHNGLRHGCISHFLSAFPENSIALVSKWSGNSEAVIQAHYRKALKQTDALRWFLTEHWSAELEERRAAEAAWIERAHREVEERPLEDWTESHNASEK